MLYKYLLACWKCVFKNICRIVIGIEQKSFQIRENEGQARESITSKEGKEETEVEEERD